ncbi:Protein of unknown function [Pyronema omphalodes CBS 100304]|uniref:Uncharacterized protein n=1 Tax=Pyronema omphalodes (strain CBS 100304) TaxID=1076935 RepID=U4LBW9_PYROM|nr:Protein of unknown function [Pyronema omphalodes CBS 100304]
MLIGPCAVALIETPHSYLLEYPALSAGPGCCRHWFDHGVDVFPTVSESTNISVPITRVPHRADVVRS